MAMGITTIIILIWIGECNRHKVINTGCGNPCSTLCGEEHVGTAEGFDGLAKCTLGRGMARGQWKGSQRCCGLLLLALDSFGARKKKREH